MGAIRLLTEWDRGMDLGEVTAEARFSHNRHSGARAKRASPESITTTGSMDSGPAPSGASTMCDCTSGNDRISSNSLLTAQSASSTKRAAFSGHVKSLLTLTVRSMVCHEIALTRVSGKFNVLGSHCFDS